MSAIWDADIDGKSMSKRAPCVLGVRPSLIATTDSGAPRSTRKKFKGEIRAFCDSYIKNSFCLPVVALSSCLEICFIGLRILRCGIKNAEILQVLRVLKKMQCKRSEWLVLILLVRLHCICSMVRVLWL